MDSHSLQKLILSTSGGFFTLIESNIITIYCSHWKDTKFTYRAFVRETTTACYIFVGQTTKSGNTLNLPYIFAPVQ